MIPLELGGEGGVGGRSADVCLCMGVTSEGEKMTDSLILKLQGLVMQYLSHTFCPNISNGK